MEAAVPAHKKALRLNVDETAVKFYYQARKGLVLPLKKGSKKKPIFQFASKGQQKNGCDPCGRYLRPAEHTTNVATNYHRERLHSAGEKIAAHPQNSADQCQGMENEDFMGE